MLTTVKNKVITMFLEAELSKPIKGNIKKVEAYEITKPIAVFVNDSTKLCFLVCIFK